MTALFEDTTAELPVPESMAPSPEGGRPKWADYKVRNRVQCDYCCRLALDSLQDSTPFRGIGSAKHKRTQDGTHLLPCHDHARSQRERDEVQWPKGSRS